MVSHANKVEIGRKWEIECYSILKNMFKDVIPLFHRKLRVDLDVVDFDGKVYSVECKFANASEFIPHITLGEKDLDADYLLLSIADRRLMYKRMDIFKDSLSKKVFITFQDKSKIDWEVLNKKVNQDERTI